MDRKKERQSREGEGRVAPKHARAQPKKSPVGTPFHTETQREFNPWVEAWPKFNVVPGTGLGLGLGMFRNRLSGRPAICPRSFGSEGFLPRCFHPISAPKTTLSIRMSGCARGNFDTTHRSWERLESAPLRKRRAQARSTWADPSYCWALTAVELSLWECGWERAETKTSHAANLLWPGGGEKLL